MNRLRALGLISILGCSIAASCGGDDTATTTTGSGGTAGNGGSTGGKAGTSGGGSAGKATGGSAGKATGGSAGSAGSGTTGGAGGGTAGSGTAGGGTAGSAPDAAGGTGGTGDASKEATGTGGDLDSGSPDVSVEGSSTDASPDVSSDGTTTTDATTSDATDAAPQTSNLCAYQCNTDADCRLKTADGGTRPSGMICHPWLKRCETMEAVCETNDDCAAIASQWSLDCTSDADCFGDVCVDAGGYGRCATQPDDTGCFLSDPLVRKRFVLPADGGSVSDAASDAAADGGSNLVTVCGATTGRCNAHKRCFTGCADDSDCAGTGQGPHCNTVSGLCECTASGQCTAAGVSSCNTTSHHCECTGNNDCTTASRNTCVQGTCGCSGAGACASPYAQATSVCE